MGKYQLVFDAVYTPRNTRLLKDADAAGAIIVSGVQMFLRQAIGQFNLFTGREGMSLMLAYLLPLLYSFLRIKSVKQKKILGLIAIEFTPSVPFLFYHNNADFN